MLNIQFMCIEYCFSKPLKTNKLKKVYFFTSFDITLSLDSSQMLEYKIQYNRIQDIIIIIMILNLFNEGVLTTKWNYLRGFYFVNFESILLDLNTRFLEVLDLSKVKRSRKIWLKLSWLKSNRMTCCIFKTSK